MAFELWRAETNGTLTCQEHGLRLVISGAGDDHGTTFTVTRLSDGYPLASGPVGERARSHGGGAAHGEAVCLAAGPCSQTLMPRRLRA